jgi:hypothetical protein
MGTILPEKEEAVRIVLRLEGKRLKKGKKLTQTEYDAFKAAIKEVVKTYGAKIEEAEYVILEKKPRKKMSGK